MKTFELPHMGSRNIKTALSVLVCLIFWPNSLFAAIAAVICVQGTVENSLVIGINRLIGTLLGGILGIVFLYIANGLNLQNFLPLIVSIGVLLIIYICNIIKKPSACSISSITLISILVSQSYNNPLMYSIRRIIETAFGVIVAILINKYIHPPKEKNTID
ncbi:FUSC family protein [Clostridium nigeriense]|uniref:FUSC family protein n=1 Tax=Clostridium nigeriense TaxID=1805470 RepID=UPI003D341B19